MVLSQTSALVLFQHSPPAGVLLTGVEDLEPSSCLVDGAWPEWNVDSTRTVTIHTGALHLYENDTKIQVPRDASWEPWSTVVSMFIDVRVDERSAMNNSTTPVPLARTHKYTRT
jgi:hypothetical protein